MLQENIDGNNKFVLNNKTKIYTRWWFKLRV